MKAIVTSVTSTQRVILSPLAVSVLGEPVIGHLDELIILTTRGISAKIRKVSALCVGSRRTNTSQNRYGFAR